MRKVDTLKKVFVETMPFVAKYGAKPNGEGVWLFGIGMTRVTESGRYAAAKNRAIEKAESVRCVVLTVIDGPKPRRFRKKEDTCLCAEGFELCPLHGPVAQAKLIA